MRRLAAALLLVVLSGCSSPGPSAHDPVACGARSLAAASDADWPVFDRTSDRLGTGVGTPAVSRATSAWAVALDGDSYGQPLVARGLAVVATEHDSVYAFDAASGCLAWRASLGAPYDVSKHPLQCGNIEPELGVTSTPAIDPATGTVYALAYLVGGRYEMNALDLATGAIRWRRAVSLPGSDMLLQLSRPALALSGGRVYASFGGRAGDCGNYHGWVVGVDVGGRGPDVRYEVTSNRGGAVWAPGGPVVLPGGDLLVATGNSADSGSFDGSEAVLRLSPDLRLLDSFAPPDWARLNSSDCDLGSVSPTLLPDGSVFQIGKGGVAYVLDAGHLGGVGGELTSAPLPGSMGCDGGGCYVTGAVAVAGAIVLVPCQDGLAAVRASAGRIEQAWRGPRFGAGSPIVAGGLAWVYDYSGGVLWGLDLASGVSRQRLSVGQGEHFASPSFSGGRLYVAAARELEAFSLQ